MKRTRKVNCIIDCDPGVDDAVAIALSLYDDILDIKLITTVNGNRDIKTVTRNVLHLLEKFNRTDIPVAVGAEKAMERVSPDASFIHQTEGLGGYVPPKTVKTKPIEKGAVEAMYDVIKENAGNIVIIEIGPQTNLGWLIKTHPDVVKMVKGIYTEGCSPYGWDNQGKWKNYISFNASSDPEALKIVAESGIPMVMVPSRAGRELANFTEKEVLSMRDINDVGRFFYEMYSEYWERGYTDRRIATNDTCAVLLVRFPELFKTKKMSLDVSTGEQHGRTIFKPCSKSHIKLVMKVNKKKMHRYFVKAVEKLNRFKFYND